MLTPKLTSLKVKNSFQWERSYSAIPYPVEIPEGAPVQEDATGTYWLDPSYFQGKPIEQTDATYYGCRIDPANVSAQD